MHSVLWQIAMPVYVFAGTAIHVVHQAALCWPSAGAATMRPYTITSGAVMNLSL